MPTLIVGTNTYVTLAEYNTFLDEILGANIDADDTTKQRSLITAFNIFQVADWQGSKTVDTQTAAWPRTDVFCDGEEIDPNTVPVNIENGQMQYANLMISNQSLVDNPTGASQTGIKRAGAGSATVEFFSNNANLTIEAERRFPTPVWELVECFLAANILTAESLASGLSDKSSFAHNRYGLNKGYA